MHRALLGAAALAVAVAAGVTAADAEPIGEPVKIEVDSPAPGVADPFDPPTVAMPDPALATLDVPDARPWMLVTTAEAESRAGTIESALVAVDTGTATTAERTLAGAWRSIQAHGDACCDGRASTEDALDRDSFEHRDFGRSDLAELGILWHVTGDDAYLAKAKQLLRYVVGISPDYGAPKEPGVDEYYIQRAHRLNGLALAYDLLHPGFDDVERAELRAVVAGLAEQEYAHAHSAWWGTISSGSNIGAHNAAALAIAGLALYDEHPDARAWLIRGEQLVRSYLHDGFDREGAGFEGILYGNYGLRIITYLEHALARAGRPGLFHVGGIDRQQEWFAYELLPGGGAVNPLNDARYYEINPTYTTWATTFGDSVTTPDGDPTDLSRWLFDNFVPLMRNGRHLGETIATVLWYEPLDADFSPEEVLPLAEDYADRGLVHVRTGWDADDFMASFEARQNDWGEGVHQDSNVNSFTLYDGPSRLIVDSRYANWLAKTTAGDEEAARTSNSEAHNYIVADGRSQDFHGKGDLVAFASTAGIGEQGAIDVALGDARLGWLTDQPERADRVFTYLRPNEALGIPDYIVVGDVFEQGDGDHEYTSFLHTEWNNDLTVTGPTTAHVTPRVSVVDETSSVGEDPRLAITIVSPHGVDLAVDRFRPDDGQDWRSLNGGTNQRRAHDRLRIESTGERFEALTVLVPHRPGEAVPTVDAVGGGHGVVVRGDGWEDWTVRDGSVGGPFLGSFADQSTIRLAGGDVWSYAMVRGWHLDHRGTLLAWSATVPITVSATADRVAVGYDEGERDPGEPLEIQVAAAAGAIVTLNGRTVATTFDPATGLHELRV